MLDGAFRPPLITAATAALLFLYIQKKKGSFSEHVGCLFFRCCQRDAEAVTVSFSLSPSRMVEPLMHRGKAALPKVSRAIGYMIHTQEVL